MELNDDARDAMCGSALQMCAILATAAARAQILHPQEQAGLAECLADMAKLMEVCSGDALPPGLASELQSRAWDLGYPRKP